jgi:hypothetical protein
MLEVHAQIKADVNNIVAEHGLKFDGWGVHDEDRNKIIQVTPIYNADKRSKYKVKGRMMKISFEPTVGIDDKTTIEELIVKEKKLNIKCNIERLESQIEAEEKELQESKQALKELQEELKNLA